MAAKQGEYLKKGLESRDIFFYRDEKEGFDVPSRVVYKKKSLVVHFPFGRDGSQKYKYIRSIEFRDIDPLLVSGVYKAVNFGLGFTRNLSPIVYRLEAFPLIRKVVISAKLDSRVSSTVITFNTGDLNGIFQTIKPFKEVQSEELRRVSNNALAEVFPDKIKRSAGDYKRGELAVFLKDKKISPEKLSEEDIQNLINVIPENIKEAKIVYQAEEKINFIKLHKVKEEFQRLVEQKTDTDRLEEKCQSFFTDNHWILSNILSMPVVLLGDKVYVGGKSIQNRGGKEADFLFKNKLTKNVFIIEIKTPLKRIIDSDDPYRKPDVFGIGKEVTGGLVQALDQKDNLQKEFYALAKGSEFISFNPKVVLIIGTIKSLTKQQLKSFELFRSSIRDVEVITYDELLKRTDLILGQFVQNGS
jgi:Domain of unknown function (DUF4263)